MARGIPWRVVIISPTALRVNWSRFLVECCASDPISLLVPLSLFFTTAKGPEPTGLRTLPGCGALRPPLVFAALASRFTPWSSLCSLRVSGLIPGASRILVGGSRRPAALSAILSPSTRLHWGMICVRCTRPPCPLLPTNRSFAPRPPELAGRGRRLDPLVPLLFGFIRLSADSRPFVWSPTVALLVHPHTSVCFAPYAQVLSHPILLSFPKVTTSGDGSFISAS